MSWRRSALCGIAVVAGLAAGVHGDEIFDWQRAGECSDRVCSVRGTVAETKEDGQVIRLYFDAARHDVYVTLVRGWLVTWPSYTGHTIVATGEVARWRGAVEILVDAPADIVDLDAATATATAATPTLAPPPTDSPPPTAAPPATDVPPPTDAPPPTPAPATAVPPPTAAPAAPAPTPGEVERLRERVRALEEELRQRAP